MTAQPDPEFRISTFGILVIKRLVLPRGLHPRYEVLSDEIWNKRYHGKKLLKALLCCDYRQASKDVLIEKLWPDADPENASHSLDEAARHLRGTLCFQEGGESLLLTVKTDQTVVYTLPNQDRLWLDVDDVQHLYHCARRARQEGEDPIPLLKEALELVNGEFLIEDLYAPWTQEQRQVVTGICNRCSTWLIELYQERGMFSEAEEWLQRLLKRDPTDEDLLCRLMEVLAHQRRPQEALDVYERFKRVLKREQEGEPAARTQALAKRMRNEPAPLELLSKEEMLPPTTGSTITVAERAPFTPSLLAGSEREGRAFLSLSTSVIPEDFALLDQAIRIGIQLDHIITLATQRQSSSLTNSELSAMINRIHQEIGMFDAFRPRQMDIEYTISRRQSIIAIATLPLTLLPAFQEGQRNAIVVEEFLSRCVASIAACQHLMKTNGLEIVEQVLPKYLPTLITLTKQSSKYQQMAAHLTTQAYLLAALVALHRHRLSGCEECYKLAMRYSQLARDPNLKIATLKQFATRLVEDHRSNEALQLFRQALQIIDDNRDEISPLLGGLIYLGAARANAQLQEKKRSEEYLSLGQQAFTEHVEHVQNHVLPYVDCGIHHLFMSEGLIRVDLKDPQGAMNIFIRIENLPSTIIIPERVYLEIINYQASTSVILRDLDGFCIYVEKGINGAKRLGSEKRRQEAIGAYRQGRSVWPNETRVRDLADLLLN